jgi:inner membrane protein
MDSLSHIGLGAVLGELVLGKKVGKTALLWGIAAENFPDIDVVLAPFMHPVDNLLVHRGYSHTILVCLALTPILGWVNWKLVKKQGTYLREWRLLWFLGLMTHLGMDALTGYGTPMFMPFSDLRVDINSIFILDPIFCFTMLIGGMTLFALKNEERRMRWAKRTLILGSCYLAITLISKYGMETVIRRDLDEKGISYNRHMSFTTPFNCILYGFIADVDSGYYMTHRSWFDGEDAIKWEYIPAYKEKVADLLHIDHFRKFAYFSKEYYCITEHDGKQYMNDMRFGRIGGWSDPAAPFVFEYEIKKTESGYDLERGDWQKARRSGIETLFSRILGGKN